MLGLSMEPVQTLHTAAVAAITAATGVHDKVGTEKKDNISARCVTLSCSRASCFSCNCRPSVHWMALAAGN